MRLPAPNLDDRRFQDILDEARRLIPRYCPEWTDHNLSDPGITLLELFAWMTDLLLYRLNRVPDKNYIKFMDLLGIRLQPARAATTDLTFRLSAPRRGRHGDPARHQRRHTAHRDAARGHLRDRPRPGDSGAGPGAHPGKSGRRAVRRLHAGAGELAAWARGLQRQTARGRRSVPRLRERSEQPHAWRSPCTAASRGSASIRPIRRWSGKRGAGSTIAGSP